MLSKPGIAISNIIDNQLNDFCMELGALNSGLVRKHRGSIEIID